MRDSVDFNQLNAPSLPLPFQRCFIIQVFTFILHFLVLHEKNGLPFILKTGSPGLLASTSKNKFLFSYALWDIVVAHHADSIEEHPHPM